MTVLRPEKQLQYLIDLAEGAVPKGDCVYRIPPDGLANVARSRGMKNVDALADLEPYPAIFLDRVEAAQELLRQHKAYKDNRLEVPAALDEYMQRCLTRQVANHPNPFNTKRLKSDGRPIDRNRQLKMEKLRALREVEEHEPSPDRGAKSALEHAAEALGIPNDAEVLERALKPPSKKRPETR